DKFSARFFTEFRHTALPTRTADQQQACVTTALQVPPRPPRKASNGVAGLSDRRPRRRVPARNSMTALTDRHRRCEHYNLGDECGHAGIQQDFTDHLCPALSAATLKRETIGLWRKLTATSQSSK